MSTLASRVLLVEDEAGLRLTLVDRLHAEGDEVTTASDGDAGLEAASRAPHDLIILDVMLPKMSGLDVCRALRQCGIATPVLMLTAKSLVTDKVVGLKLGADDYLTKTFETIEMPARIEALLRRRTTGVDAGAGSYRFGEVSVDFRKMEVRRGTTPVDLSAREFKLLQHLTAHRGETLSRDALLTDVWGYDDMPLTRTVDVHVAGLRQKLEDNPKSPEFILTIHGFGYKFAG